MPFLSNIDSLIPMAIVFLMVSTRIGLLFIMAPLFSLKVIPARIKAAIVAIISLSIFVSLPDGHEALPLDLSVLTLAFLGEVSIGAAAGLSAQMVFAAVDGAGRLLGIPMGLGFARVADPLSGENTVVISRFFTTLISMVFLILDAHHVLIGLLCKSFLILPPGQVQLSPFAARTLADQGTLIFNGAVQLAAPVLLVILGVKVAMALLAKIAPKVNLMVLSFAISIGLGLVALRAAMPNLVAWIRGAVLRIEPLTAQVIGSF